jgi:hypothetical protein
MTTHEEITTQDLLTTLEEWAKDKSLSLQLKASALKEGIHESIRESRRAAQDDEGAPE